MARSGLGSPRQPAAPPPVQRSLEPELRQLLTCPVCRELLDDALQPPCRHLACRACLDATYRGQSRNRKCPFCNVRYAWKEVRPAALLVKQLAELLTEVV